MKLFSWRNLLIGLCLVFFAFGGYVGYLSALVDQDERIFIERVVAATDKARLEKQLARAQSILDARSRAYLRRSQDFINQKRAEQGQEALPKSDQKNEQVREQVDQNLATLEQASNLTSEDRKQLASLQEEQQDLGFFEDEVEVLEQLIAREPDQEELRLLFAGEKQRKRISSGLRELLKLLDKRRELSEKRVIAKDGFQYWEQNPRSAPSGVKIAVQNKGQIQRTLNDLHVTQISTALSVMPQGFDGRLRNLYVVYGDPKMRRGLTGLGVVFMKGEELDFFRVLVHEFGHIQDLHREVSEGTKSAFYDGPYRLFQEDPSVAYYQLSWDNTYQRRGDPAGFASTYGMSDPFEDYAEAFALYVLQGDTFRDWASQSSVMGQKYTYFNEMFGGRTFASTQRYSSRPYDVTMMVVSYEELLNIQGS